MVRPSSDGDNGSCGSLTNMGSDVVGGLVWENTAASWDTGLLLVTVSFLTGADGGPLVMVSVPALMVIMVPSPD